MPLLLLFSLLLFSQLCAAQSNRVQLDETTIVKDSTGRQYTMAEWEPLLKMNYTLRTANPKDRSEGWLLVKLTDEQIIQKHKMIKEQMESMPKPKETQNFSTGSKLGLFNTEDIDGNKLNMKNPEGKIIVLNFWFINCGPCRREIPELNELVDSFGKSGKVMFVGIALDNKAALKTFLEKMPFKYSIVDNGRFATERYRINLYPTHVIIDTEGKVYFHTSGLAPNTVYWIKKSLKELLDKKETKTAGK